VHGNDNDDNDNGDGDDDDVLVCEGNFVFYVRTSSSNTASLFTAV